jgi:SAM-dependent methyltransferase
VLFALDTPRGRELSRVTRFSGWLLSDVGQPAKSIRLTMNGRPLFQLAPIQRLDVAAAFTNHPFAVNAGFVGELVLPNNCQRHDKVWVAIEVDSPVEGNESVFAADFVVAEPVKQWSARARSYNLSDLLQDPRTGKPIRLEDLAECDSAEGTGCLVAGIPHFHPRYQLPLIRLLEGGSTALFSEKSRQSISELKSGEIFLDFGAGIKNAQDIALNAVYLDAVHFPNVDVVNTAENLPLKSDAFDLVISQAVFEHLPNPCHTANEIFRVLKPGGKVLIETAFMQPLHADPSHYFNMTMEGLRRVVEKFEILELGVQPYQMPSDGLIMQLEAIRPVMKSGVWRQRMEQLLNDLRREGRDLDRDLGIIGQRMIAAGVSVVARKR